MSYRSNKLTCDRISKFNSTLKSVKCVKKLTPKKVVTSKKFVNCCENGKSYSTGIIIHDNNTKSSKQSKSDGGFSRTTRRDSLDICKKCGDVKTTASLTSSSKIRSTISQTYTAPLTPSNTRREYAKSQKSNIKPKESKGNGFKQFYKNENYVSTESLQDAENEFRKMSLDTIKEVPSVSTNDDIVTAVYEVYSDSEEEIGFLDVNDAEKIEDLKKFRDDNYFECHSVKSRVDNKGSATSLMEHKCVYRFYLNDRLFPVPISTDHHGTVRCVECHLPMDLKGEEGDNKVNGTIQAKAKLSSGEAQDMILLLPVKDSLIIKEKRKQIKADEEVLYFGVVKLDSFGNSVFKSTLPTDSLALKYQKGYREYDNTDDYKYKGVEENDIIII